MVDDTCMGAYKHVCKALYVAEMGAYIPWVLILYGCVLSQQ